MRDYSLTRRIGTSRFAHIARWGILSGLLLAGPNAFSLAADTPVKIGAEDDWYPFSALRDGEIQGMSVDIVRAAFGAGGAHVELQPYPYPRCMQSSLQGDIAGCFDTTPNAAIRAQYLLPEEPLFNADIVLWARRDNPLTSITQNQLSGRTVVVTGGYEYGATFDSDKSFRRVVVRRDLHGFRMLAHHRADYVVAFRRTAQSLFNDEPELSGQFKPVMLIASPALYISFSRKNPHSATLIKQFDRGMRMIRANGSYQKILDHWQHPLTAE